MPFRSIRMPENFLTSNLEGRLEKLAIACLKTTINKHFAQIAHALLGQDARFTLWGDRRPGWIRVSAGGRNQRFGSLGNAYRWWYRMRAIWFHVKWLFFVAVRPCGGSLRMHPWIMALWRAGILNGQFLGILRRALKDLAILPRILSSSPSVYIYS